MRQADGVRVEDNTILGRSETLERVDPLKNGLTPGDGELCAVPLNQNRRGNGVHVWNSTGHVIARNVIRDTRDGIYFSFVDGSEVRDNDIAQVRYGLHYMYSDDNRFEGNVFRDNAAGAALMYSKGLVLRRNRFVANRSHRAYGLLLQSVDDTLDHRRTRSPATRSACSSRTATPTACSTTASPATTSASASATAPMATCSRATASPATSIRSRRPATTSRTGWALDGRGNEWEGALRLDLDGNGIGDLPHRELDLFGELRRPFPAIGLLAGSPGERLLRFVHARLALPGVAGIVDPAPLVPGDLR